MNELQQEQASGELQSAESTENIGNIGGGEEFTGENANIEKKVEFNGEQQKRFNEVYWRANQAEREVEQLKKQLETIPQQSSGRPEKGEDGNKASDPKFPDDDLKYDNPEQYAKQLQEWQSQVAKNAQNAAIETLREEQSKQAEQQQAQLQQAQLKERVKTFEKNALDSGIDVQKIINAEQVVAGYKPSQGVVNFIMTHEKGPHITNYLAENQEELSKVVGMSDMQAAVYLNQIGSKVSDKTVTSAPDPVDSLKGGGVPDEHPALAGAKFL